MEWELQALRVPGVRPERTALFARKQSLPAIIHALWQFITMTVL